MKYSYIKQHDERDCGAACLVMLASYYGTKISLAKCREYAKTDLSGTNLYGMIDGADKIGLELTALEGDRAEFKESLQNGEIKTPFIAHVISDNNMYHFVVVYKILGNRMLIGDPEKGKVRLDLDYFLDCWTGYILACRPRENYKPVNVDKHNFKYLFSLLSGQVKNLIAVLIISIVVSLIGVMGAFIFQIAIDSISYTEIEIEHEEDNEEHEHGMIETVIESASDIDNLDILFSILIAFYIFSALLQYLRNYLIIMTSRKIDIRLTLLYFFHTLELPISSLSLRQTGEYLSRFSDTSIVRNAISNVTITLVFDSLMAIGTCILLAVLNFKLFVIVLIVVVAYAAIVILYKKPIHNSNMQIMESNSKLESFFKESIDGIETIKSLDLIDYVEKKAKTSFNSFWDLLVNNSLITSSQEIIVSTFEIIGQVVLLWAGFQMTADSVISIGELITFYALFSFFIEPVKNLLNLQTELQSAFVAIDRLNDILLSEKENSDGNIKEFSFNSCQFRNVDFRYGNRNLIFNNLNMSIERGDRIGIIGENGTGKSTFAKLLTAFYKTEKGDILINGESISEYDVNALRKKIVYMTQSAFFFAGTIRDNLCLGNEGIDIKEIEIALEQTGADKFVSELPFGIDFILEENGTNISGGQRQKLAMARCLLRKPELIILDESTSNLDEDSKNMMLDMINAFDHNITFIVISHEQSLINYCNKVYNFREGRAESV